MIEITTGILAIMSTFSVGPVNSVVNENMSTDSSNKEITEELVKSEIKNLSDLEIIENKIINNEVLTIKETEEYLKNYFKETPVMIEIARCESSFRHFDQNGNVLKGKVNDDDIGVMQINKYYHEKDAIKLGLDLYTMKGNLEFAKNLYERQGARPWVHSSKCWGQGVYSNELAKN